MTLGRIGGKDTSVHLNGMMVHAFDGTKTAALGGIDLKVTIRPCEFKIPFVVVNIPTLFKLLLARIWIRTVGDIPSSLHQKVKVISGNNLISAIAEEDLIVPSCTLVSFIKAHQTNHASRYHSF